MLHGWTARVAARSGQLGNVGYLVYRRLQEPFSAGSLTDAARPRPPADKWNTGMSLYWPFYFCAWFVGSAYFLRAARKHRLSLSIAWDAAVLSLLLALIGGHLAFGLLEARTVQSYADFFCTWRGWTAGYISFGGVLGVLLTLAITARLHRKPFLFLADLAAPTVFIASALGRLGCFYHGCCYGAPTSVPWAVQFTERLALGQVTVPSHPVQLYEALLSSLALVGTLRIRRGRAFVAGSGQLLALCLFGYSAIRFLVEFFRIGGSSAVVLGGFSTTQLVALVGATVCGWILVRHWMTGPKTRVPSHR